MKNISLLAILIPLIFNLHAQVVLDVTMAPEAGTTIILKKMQDPASFQFIKTGTNLTWDFTTSAIDGQDTLYYVDPASTGYASSFPAANLALRQTETEVAFIENATPNSRLLGVVADTGNGVMVLPLSPPLTLFSFPYTYGSQINSTSKTTIRGTGAQFGMPFDSVRLVSTIITQRSVNAWGNLILLHGNYPGSLLEKGITKQIDSAWAKIPFFGWIPAIGFPQTSVDTSYRWFTDELLHPFAEISSNEEGIFTGNFYSGNLTGTPQLLSPKDVVAYPNPAGSFVTLVFPENTLDAHIVLTDLSGKTHIKTCFTGARCIIPTNQLQPGVYLLSLHAGVKTIYTSKLVKK